MSYLIIKHENIIIIIIIHPKFMLNR